MTPILVPSRGVSDWQRLLADPVKHWVRGRSAFELATSWESAVPSARGLPKEVGLVLDSIPELRDCEVLIAIPEHKVDLDGGRRPSQTDLWALLRSAHGLASMAVEGKAGEPFDRPVSEWLSNASDRSGKPERLKQLCGLLGLEESAVPACRYQLLHRTAAAILEARRFGASRAVMLVQSFTSDPESMAAYAHFGRLLGAEAGENAAIGCGSRGGVDLFIGWVSSPRSVALREAFPIE